MTRTRSSEMRIATPDGLSADLRRSGHDGPAPPDTSLSIADAVVAGAGALLTLGVYLATMYPGLSAIGDQAKFSFVGKVLGTPHAPGYPLYVLVSHAFSYVPFGTLAFRMNLLSVLLGVTTVILTYFIARRLGTSRMVAVATMLALGFGNAFWSRSLYAKGYTLNAALIASGILLLLRWSRTRRLWNFYQATAVFALSLGNHLIVVALLPALVLYSLTIDFRAVIRLRSLATIALLGFIGLCQYAYILIRTWQKAPYLEARAENLSQLWAVMTARRFAHEIGAFTVSDLLHVRIPGVSVLIGGELGLLGLALSLAGIVALVVQRRREVILFALGAVGVAVLTMNMSSNEDEGFLLPMFVLLWPLIGVGLDWMFRAVARAPSAVAMVATIGLAVFLPVRQVVRNYGPNDRHTETSENRYFEALFAVLPSKAAIVNDEYHLNQMVLYKLLGEEAAGARTIQLIPQDRETVARFVDAGFDVFAFREARNTLTDYGFRLAPFNIPGQGAAEAAVRRREIFRVVWTPVCFDIGNREWVDITKAAQPKGRISVRVDNYRPFDTSVTTYAGVDGSIDPTLVGIGGAGNPTFDVETFPHGDAKVQKQLAARVLADRVTLPDAILEAPFVARVHVRVNDRGAYSTFGLDLGRGTKTTYIRALVDLDNPKRATVCSHPLADTDAWPVGQPRVTITPASSDVQLGDGWYALERRSDGLSFAWASDRAVLVVPLDHPRSATLSVVGEPLNFPSRRGGAMTLVVNGHRFDRHQMPPGSTSFSWHVPSERWRDGLNEVVLEIEGARRPSDVGLSSDDRLLGVAVTQFELRVADPG